MRRWHVIGVLCLAVTICSCGKKEPPPTPAVRVAPETFTYQEAPTVAMIPNGAIKGELAGRAFAPGTIFFAPGMDKWRVYVIENSFDDPTDAGFGDDGMMMQLEFGVEPAKGKKFVKVMDHSDGIITYYRDDDSLYDWSGRNAFAIEFTKWDVAPFDPDNQSMVAGKASGYLALCFEGNDNVTHSWVAGQFTDVPVMYRGTPFWLQDE